MKLAFFASHGGSSMKSIFNACQDGFLVAAPVVCISNNGQSEALRWAKEKGLLAVHASGKTHPNPDDLYHEILGHLTDNNVTHIVLSGYMRMIDERIVKRFENKILNIHPALLPKFGGKGMYGINVHQAVIDSGETETGATIHLVNDQYDEGPIVAQAKVSVYPSDTPEELRARVSEIEGKLYIAVLKRVISGDIDLDRISSGTQKYKVLSL